MRDLDRKDVEKQPANGFLVLGETIKNRAPRADRHGARVRQGHDIAADAKADKYGR